MLQAAITRDNLGRFGSGFFPTKKKHTPAEIDRRIAFVEGVVARTPTTRDLYSHNGVYNEDRAALHQRIVNDFLRRADADGVPRNSELVVSGGISGAGKGTSLAKLGELTGHPIGPHTHIALDPDRVKDVLLDNSHIPDGLKKMEAAGIVHDESVHVSTLIARAAAKRGYNVVLDQTLGHEPSARARLRPFQRAGYAVDGVFVDVPISVAHRRARARYVGGMDTIDGGRLVPRSVIDGFRSKRGTTSRDTFDALRKEGAFRRTVVVDNSGASPRIVDANWPGVYVPGQRLRSAADALHSGSSFTASSFSGLLDAHLQGAMTKVNTAGWSWDSVLHPRGPGGKFAKKLGADVEEAVDRAELGDALKAPSSKAEAATTLGEALHRVGVVESADSFEVGDHLSTLSGEAVALKAPSSAGVPILSDGVLNKKALAAQIPSGMYESDKVADMIEAYHTGQIAYTAKIDNAMFAIEDGFTDHGLHVLKSGSGSLAHAAATKGIGYKDTFDLNEQVALNPNAFPGHAQVTHGLIAYYAAGGRGPSSTPAPAPKKFVEVTASSDPAVVSTKSFQKKFGAYIDSSAKQVEAGKKTPESHQSMVALMASEHAAALAATKLKKASNKAVKEAIDGFTTEAEFKTLSDSMKADHASGVLSDVEFEAKTKALGVAFGKWNKGQMAAASGGAITTLTPGSAAHRFQTSGVANSTAVNVVSSGDDIAPLVPSPVGVMAAKIAWTPAGVKGARDLEDHLAAQQALLKHPLHERAALSRYQGSDYEAINGYLRGNVPGASEADTVGELDQLFARHPLTEPAAVSRGVTSDWDASKLKKNLGVVGHPSELVGKSIREDGYLSTSHSVKAGFDKEGISGGVTMRIVAAPGVRAIALNHIPGYKTLHAQENEVLIDRGAVMHVVGYEQLPNGSHVLSAIITHHETGGKGSPILRDSAIARQGAAEFAKKAPAAAKEFAAPQRQASTWLNPSLTYVQARKDLALKLRSGYISQEQYEGLIGELKPSVKDFIDQSKAYKAAKLAKSPGVFSKEGMNVVAKAKRAKTWGEAQFALYVAYEGGHISLEVADNVANEVHSKLMGTKAPGPKTFVLDGRNIFSSQGIEAAKSAAEAPNWSAGELALFDAWKAGHVSKDFYAKQAKKLAAKFMAAKSK